MTQYRQLRPGEPAPWFKQRSTSNRAHVFDTAAGRFIVLCFFGSASDEAGRAALEFTSEHRRMFDDQRVSFFGISVDRADEDEGRARESLPGIRHFWDFDAKASRLYGALPISMEGEQLFRRLWVVLDPGLNVLAVLPFALDGSDRRVLADTLRNLPPVPHYAGMEMHAPVLVLPRVFEPELCARLISEYDKHGGDVSGFMQEINGRTVPVHDARHKSRSDYLIDDEQLRNLLQRRLRQKVLPMVARAHCFHVTRIERYIVGCYDSENGGHFRAHRDNTTKGTAHRRFALSLNLNDDFDGGELSFPEYGPRSYKIPAGGAVLFSGSLLHQVSPVVRGRRYAFLPFLYDEAAAAIRESNAVFLAAGPEEVNGTGARSAQEFSNSSV